MMVSHKIIKEISELQVKGAGKQSRQSEVE
jgi:hypothetical protein